MVLDCSSDTTDHFPSVSWWSCSATADILTCWSAYPPGETSSLHFNTVPRVSLSRYPNTDYCLTFHYWGFFPALIIAWKPPFFAPAQRHVSFNGVMKIAVIPPVDLLLPVFAGWPMVDLLLQSYYFPSYVISPSTEDIISVRHQILSPAQR